VRSETELRSDSSVPAAHRPELETTGLIVVLADRIAARSMIGHQSNS